MSRRTARVGSLIRSIVSEAIQSRLSDPRIESLTSITRVDVSADLSVARVHVSVMASDAKQKLCLQALQHAAGRLRALVARQVEMRQIPHLDFCLDDSVQRAFETVQAIDTAIAELGEPPPWEADREPAAGESAPPTRPDDPVSRIGRRAEPETQEDC